MQRRPTQGEVCEHCLQAYSYEQEYRCRTCDGPVCADCVVGVRRTEAYYCPSCHAEREPA